MAGNMPSFPELCPTIGNGETKRNEAGNEQKTKRHFLCKIGNGPEMRNGNEAPFFALVVSSFWVRCRTAWLQHVE